jgi:hypothetical protein
MLAPVLPASVSVCQGQQATTYSIESLPPALRSALAAAAARQFYRDARHMLDDPTESWQPPIPLSQVKSDALAKAVKLRAAIATALQGKDSTAISAQEREQAGVADYVKSFGHDISARHWRRLFHRAIDRDRNQLNWMRVELYLDDDISPRRQPRRAALALALPEDVADTVRTLVNPAAPTSGDRKFLFDAALRHLETAEPGEQAAVKRGLICGLYHAVPALVKTEKAFRCMFNRKLAAWMRSDDPAAALEDKRRLNSGNFRKPDFSADENKIRDEAILHGGNESLAHLKLRERGELSPAFISYYHFDPRQNKSYLPATVRAGITPQVEMCGAIHRGPWLAKMKGPYIPRDWSDVAPADWFSGDDCTWNNYFYFYDDAGQLHIERGECLVLHDLRTGYVFDYVLIAGKYNSRHIRKLILQVHDKHGLPFKGFYFERGVWKARIIRDLDSRENFHWRETESGLANFNLQVRHATTPRAKPIEGLFHILQERQRNEPGFVGFNERSQEMERMQDFLARARRGTAEPSKQLLSMEQWTARLDEIFGEYIRSPQNGKLLDGRSPAEAWQAGLDRRQPRKLPDDARYLLATHCKPVKVHQYGIVLTIGGNKMLFYNERTGQLIGQEVLAFYNLDCPDLLTVSDLNRQNYFTVKSISLPAMSATKEQFSEVHTAIAGHRRAAKIIYGNIQHPTIATITRDNDASEETKELGRFVNQEAEQFQEEQTATTRKLRKISRDATALGLAVPRNVRNPDRVQEGIDLTAAALARLERRERETSTGKDQL